MGALLRLIHATPPFERRHALLLRACCALFAVAGAPGAALGQDLPPADPPPRERPAVPEPAPEPEPSPDAEPEGPGDGEAGDGGKTDEPAPAPGPPPTLEERVARFLSAHAEALDTWRSQGSPGGNHPLRRSWAEAQGLVDAGWSAGRLWLLERVENGGPEATERARRRRGLLDGLFARPLEPHAVEGAALGLARALAHGEVEATDSLARVESLLLAAPDGAARAAALVARAEAFARRSKRASAEVGDAARAEELARTVRVAFPGSRAAAQAADLEFRLLDRQYEAALEAWWAARGAEGEEREEAHPATLWRTRVQALADTGVGRARWWLVTQAGHAVVDPAERLALRRTQLDALVRDHHSEPWLADAVRLSEGLADQLGLAVVVDMGERLLAKSENPDVRAWSLHGLATLYAREEGDPRAADRAALLWRRLLAEQPEHRLARGVEALLFELEFLRLGRVPPDVVARDVHGRDLRLSHSRGLVTLVVFWGFWSPPSVEFMRGVAGLETRFADQPFVVLGVNTDADREEYLRQREALGGEWLDAFQGSPGGPWPSRWNVRRFPSSFLLDADGVLRERDQSLERLEERIGRLVRELRPGTGRFLPPEPVAEEVEPEPEPEPQPEPVPEVEPAPEPEPVPQPEPEPEPEPEPQPAPAPEPEPAPEPGR